LYLNLKLCMKIYLEKVESCYIYLERRKRKEKGWIIEEKGKRTVERSSDPGSIQRGGIVIRRGGRERIRKAVFVSSLLPPLTEMKMALLKAPTPQLQWRCSVAPTTLAFPNSHSISAGESLPSFTSFPQMIAIFL